MTYISRKFSKEKGKYKGKLPLKYFDCGGIGHFASKYPKKNKNEDSDDDEPKYNKINKSYNFKKRNFKKRSLISKESNEESEDEAEGEDWAFIAIE